MKRLVLCVVLALVTVAGCSCWRSDRGAELSPDWGFDDGDSADGERDDGKEVSENLRSVD